MGNNIQNFLDYIEEHKDDLIIKYSGYSYPYYRYLLDYCDGRGNALYYLDSSLEDEIIDRLMEDSGATNIDFFGCQNSHTLVALCEPYFIQALITNRIENEQDEED